MVGFWYQKMKERLLHYSAMERLRRESSVFQKPAMSITGSGAHGIIATMPLYAVYKINNYTDEQLLRATALSHLVCMYIKEYSGKLSAFCGCAIAAGTGMACALAWLKGAGAETMEKVINNMAEAVLQV